MSICRSQQPYVIKPRNSDSMSSVGSSALPAIENHDALSNDIALSPIMNHDANMETEVVTFTSPPQSPSNDLDECSTPSTAAATKGISRLLHNPRGAFPVLYIFSPCCSHVLCFYILRFSRFQFNVSPRGQRC